HAINTRRDSSDLRRTRGSHGAGCSGGSSPGNVVYSKCSRFCRRGFYPGTFVCCVSTGKKRVSLRQHYARYHFAHSAFSRRVDHCPPPVLRSLRWNYRRPRASRRVDRATTYVCETNRRIIVAGICCPESTHHRDARSALEGKEGPLKPFSTLNQIDNQDDERNYEQ